MIRGIPLPKFPKFLSSKILVKTFKHTDKLEAFVNELFDKKSTDKFYYQHKIMHLTETEYQYTLMYRQSIYEKLD